jgi:hypothetical protein
MERIMILALLSLTLFEGQAVLAQGSASNDQNTAVARPVIIGEMIRKFAKRGSRKRTETADTFESVSVRYNERSRQWWIFTKATGRDMLPGRTWDTWIKYNERTGLLVISQVAENRNQWSVKNTRRVKVEIDKDKTTFRLDFIGDVNGTNNAGYNYNWMRGSWLLVTR